MLENQQAQSAKILLVDDRPDGLLALEAMLRAPGYEFVCARSGKEALRRVAESGGDLAVILMDVQMPVINGFEAATLIKREERFKHIPILFVTGIHDDPHSVAQAYDTGAIDYVTKPVEPRILRSKVSVLVDLHRKTKLLTEMVCREHETELALREKALRDSERRFRGLTRCAPVGIFLTDAAGKCLFMNERFQELSAKPGPALCADSTGWIGAVHPEDRAVLQAAWREALRTTSEFHTLCRFRRTSGEIRWVKICAEPCHDDEAELEGYIGCAVDVTESKRHEDHLREAADALSRSNAELQRFAWIASHDLKEPLRMISNYVKLLERRYKGKLDAAADEYINYAVDGATRMYALVDGILRFSGVDQGAQTRRESDLNAIFDSAVMSLEDSVRESGAAIRRGELPMLLVDPAQVGQLFQNLISNSLKFRGESPPCIEVSAERRGNEWQFSFRDNGIGFEPCYAEKIFVMFQRLHGTDRYPGTGVGLAVCKKIVEKHGGRMGADSVPGLGTTFHFSLPHVERI